TQVSAYTVKEGQASYHIEYPATVVALNQIEIRPEVSGYLTDIYFKDGQHVTKGMKLYAIDQQQYKAAYDVAKANLNKAQQDYNRYKELAKNNAIATQVLEHSLADLKAAESNLNEVETNLKNSIISAPFDGTIGISRVKLGSAVTAGQSLMNTLSSDNPMGVDFSIDEKEISKFNNLLHKKYNSGDSTFTIRLPDGTIYPYPGHLILLDRAVDPQTGTITARLEFHNQNNILRPGLTCNVRVLNTTSPGSVIIPYKAVVVQMGEYFVFVINGKKVSQTRIETGRSIRDMIIVTNGLKPGEQIVTEGVQKLRDNSPIVLANSNNNTKKEKRTE
ncbi:MAG: efflux RND transporter periplasmic adaptor subunit, partial [Ignavibacteriaceae bacterium]